MLALRQGVITVDYSPFNCSYLFSAPVRRDGAGHNSLYRLSLSAAEIPDVQIINSNVSSSFELIRYGSVRDLTYKIEIFSTNWDFNTALNQIIQRKTARSR